MRPQKDVKLLNVESLSSSKIWLEGMEELPPKLRGNLGVQSFFFDTESFVPLLSASAKKRVHFCFITTSKSDPLPQHSISHYETPKNLTAAA